MRVTRDYTIQGIGFNDIVIDDNGVFTGIYNEATGIFYNIEAMNTDILPKSLLGTSSTFTAINL